MYNTQQGGTENKNNFTVGTQTNSEYNGCQEESPVRVSAFS